MGKAKRLLYTVLFVVGLVAAGLFVINNYSFIFSRHVRGEIIGVERVVPPMAIVNSGNNTLSNEAMFSFAVAIRDELGIIHSASSEDRQWAIAHPGYCADAVFYPYPFWNFEKRGTYMNARLLQLSDCPGGVRHGSMATGTKSVEATAPAGTPGAEGVVATPPSTQPAAVQKNQ